MAGKRFNPFEDMDDDLEFVPGGGAAEEAPPDDNPLANQATRIKQIPVERPKRKSNLKLGFEELQEHGTDTRGATEIGAEKLGADEFLGGIKRKDYDQALERAKAAQNAPAYVPVQESRIARTVRTPLYWMALGIVLFSAALYFGNIWYRSYLEHQNLERIKAIQSSTPH
jgi:hypothetical protein